MPERSAHTVMRIIKPKVGGDEEALARARLSAVTSQTRTRRRAEIRDLWKDMRLNWDQIEHRVPVIKDEAKAARILAKLAEVRKLVQAASDEAARDDVVSQQPAHAPVGDENRGERGQ